MSRPIVRDGQGRRAEKRLGLIESGHFQISANCAVHSSRCGTAKGADDFEDRLGRRKADVSNVLSGQATFFACHIAFGYSVTCIKSWVDAQANLPLPGKVDRESGCGS